ncbi:TonB-dependent receptor [Dyella silvatica]|uniref:TonB-dependent receptor n=1 Tax=Dyella silvatica TaxID=2992128 RepID=UPI0022500747|nr:TonB-dependent receptor [Dyella silvatica]
MRAELEIQEPYHRRSQIWGRAALTRRTALFTAMSLCLFAGSQHALAQNAIAANAGAQTTADPSVVSNSGNTKKPDENKASDKKPVVLEAVSVSGILGSLNRTIETKRDETAVVDAISAEDVGKFPDTNLAESLQHITGVQITRDGNGEGQYVTVRGLPTDFTLATFNGISTTSVNPGVRTFDFNLISPDFVQTLKVYKSSRADLDEGGIAANVDMETVSPFGIGKERTLLTAKMQGSPGETSNRNYPDITGLYSNVFDNGRFGVTVGFDWNKRFFLNQSSDASPLYGVTINGKGPYYAYSETGYSNQQSKIDTRTGYVSVQWKPIQSTTATLTGFYAHRDSYYATADFGVVPLEPYGQSTYNGPGADYSVDKNGVFTRLNMPDVAYTFYNTVSNDRSTMKNLRLNVATRVGNWDFSETAQYSSSHDTLAWVRPLLINSAVANQTPTPGAPIYGGYQIYPGAAVQGYLLDPSINVSNATSWVNQQFKDVYQTSGDTLKSLQADITRSFNEGVIQSIKFGAKVYNRARPFNYNYWVYAFPAGNANFPFSAVTQSPSWANSVLGNYNGPGVRPSSLFFINPNQWINQNFGSLDGFRNNPQTQLISNPGNHWDMVERGRDAYVMANFGFNGAVPISGNFGARYVDTTEQFLYNAYNLANIVFPPCQIGVAGCEGAKFPPVTKTDQRGGSHEVLPSLNAVADLGNDMNLRFAASKTISLPTIDSMVPVPTINIDAFLISEGNANLKPFSSINYDLSWEWYFRSSSMLSLAAYDKKIHGFIQEGAATQNIGGYTFHVSYPVNGSNGYVRGIEADYKQALDFLPSFWSGFGFEVNGTYSKGQQDAAPQYNIVATSFPGLSKLTYNATLFYEKYGFSGMITLNHRGQYMIDQNLWGLNTTEEIGNSRTQVDMQAQYKIDDHVAIFLDMKNAFDKPHSQRAKHAVSRLMAGQRSPRDGWRHSEFLNVLLTTGEWLEAGQCGKHAAPMDQEAEHVKRVLGTGDVGIRSRRLHEGGRTAAASF